MLPVTIVAATRRNQADFAQSTALGRSLQTYAPFGVKALVAFENKRGLGACYNEAIATIDNEEEIIVFVHDDVTIADFYWVDKLMLGLSKFDVIGLAGNKRRVPRQPAWAFTDDKFTWDDRSNLSGIVGHGEGFPCALDVYGDVFQPLKLLDGVLLATRKKTFTKSGVRFDERFKFHFYDMDICRQFEEKNISMAAAPVGVIHRSNGAFGGPEWRAGYETYLEKWESDARANAPEQKSPFSSNRQQDAASAQDMDASQGETKVRPTPLRTGRSCLLILGMHRSGTSALTRVMSLMGAGLPKHVMGANHGNDTGHWEPERLVAVHDQMMAEAGTTWDDCAKFDIARLSPFRVSQFRAAISHIIAEEFGAAPLIVLKDPRICRFTSLYAEILEGMGYEPKFIHVTRNPLSVAASLETRDGMAPAFAKLLWLRYVLDADVATRGRNRSFISYETLMQDWRPLVAGVSDHLDLGWAADETAQRNIDAFLKREHMHHAADPAALLADASSSGWLKSAYPLLLALEGNPDDMQAQAQLDQLRRDFDHAALYMAEPITAKFGARNHQLMNEVATLRREFAAPIRASA